MDRDTMLVLAALRLICEGIWRFSISSRERPVIWALAEDRSHWQMFEVGFGDEDEELVMQPIASIRRGA